MKAKKRSSAPLGAGLVVGSSVVYASYGIWIVLLGGYFSDVMQAILRSVLVVVLLLPFAIYRHELTPIRWRRDAWLFGGLLISSALIPIPIIYAIKTIGVGLGTGVAYAGIVIGTFLFGRILNHEKFSIDKWCATIIALIGLYFVFGSTAKTFVVLGLLAAIVNGLASGMNMVINKMLPYSPAQTAILSWSAAALANIGFGIILGEHAPKFHYDIHWLYLLIFGIASLIASTLINTGLKLIEAGAAGILGLLEIVFGVAYGMVFFHERLSQPIVIGLICIIAAAAIPYVRHHYETIR